MAPKGKRAGPQKGTLGAKGKVSADASTAAALVSGAAASSWEAPPPEPPSAQKRKLSRRDTDDAVDRALEARLLPHFPRAVVEGAVNSKGQRVRDVVAEQIRQNRSSSKKLTSCFWADVAKSFKLTPGSIADTLAQPPDGERVSEVLLEKLGVAHAENPAVRSTEPLERFLENCEILSYTEMYGIIRASMEGPKITKASSCRLLLACVKYMARRLATCSVRF